MSTVNEEKEIIDIPEAAEEVVDSTLAEETVSANPVVDVVAPTPAENPSFGDRGGFRGGRGGGDRRKNDRKPRPKTERAKQEFDNKILSIRRVTRVVSGGRRFSFSIAIVIGDRKGRVGVGLGKAGDTPIAIEKAIRSARKALVTLNLTKKNSIAHPVEAKYSSARVKLMPAPGKGMIAGSAIRVVLELAGVKEISSKILSRSKNKINIARSTVKALSQIRKSQTKKE